MIERERERNGRQSERNVWKTQTGFANIIWNKYLLDEIEHTAAPDSVSAGPSSPVGSETSKLNDSDAKVCSPAIACEFSNFPRFIYQ